MNRNQGSNWIKVRLKTLGDLRIAWQKTWCWQNPYIPSHFPPADRAVIPYLGKTVSVKELDIDSCKVIYELKDPGGLIVLPEWIDQILPDDSVPPSGWHKRDWGETWVELVEDRSLVLDDTVIIHG